VPLPIPSASVAAAVPRASIQTANRWPPVRGAVAVVFGEGGRGVVVIDWAAWKTDDLGCLAGCAWRGGGGVRRERSWRCCDRLGGVEDGRFGLSSRSCGDCPPAEHLIFTVDVIVSPSMQCELLDMFKLIKSNDSGYLVYSWWVALG
jgi:hypothetical protein